MATASSRPSTASTSAPGACNPRRAGHPADTGVQGDDRDRRATPPGWPGPHRRPEDRQQATRQRTAIASSTRTRVSTTARPTSSGAPRRQPVRARVSGATVDHRTSRPPGRRRSGWPRPARSGPGRPVGRRSWRSGGRCSGGRSRARHAGRSSLSRRDGTGRTTSTRRRPRPTAASRRPPTTSARVPPRSAPRTRGRSRPGCLRLVLARDRDPQGVGGEAHADGDPRRRVVDEGGQQLLDDPVGGQLDVRAQGPYVALQLAAVRRLRSPAAAGRPGRRDPAEDRWVRPAGCRPRPACPVSVCRPCSSISVSAADRGCAWGSPCTDRSRA